MKHTDVVERYYEEHGQTWIELKHAPSGARVVATVRGREPWVVWGKLYHMLQSEVNNRGLA